jgi:thiol-disulfide isomerase/thioredoxin
MKNILKILSGCLVVFVLFAPNARADGRNLTAAQAWSALTDFCLPQPPMDWQTNPPTEEQLAKFDDEQANQAGALADRERDFYTQFPDDTNVSRARTTEIQALQLAVHFGATNRLADLNLRESAMIADTNAPEELRYELRLDQIGREMQAASGVDSKTAMEKAGRELVGEFPGGPAGYEILQELAENSDLLKMQELGELMANSGGPPELTEIGKGLLRRLDAIGKPLPIEFTAADGRVVNATTLSNKVVLVDFWGTWCPVCVQETPDLKKLYEQYHAKGFEIVGIDFDDDTNAVQQFIQRQDLPWPQYFGGKTDNKYAALYSLNYFPAVWLVDRKGILQDIHGRVDMEAKVAKLMAE